MGNMAIKFAKPTKVSRTGSSGNLAEIRAFADELAEFTIDQGGTDNLPESGWVSPISPHNADGAEYEFLHFEDNRAGTGLVYAIRTGRTILSNRVNADEGYFQVEANNCGEQHKIVIVRKSGETVEPTQKGTNVSMRYVTRDSVEYDEAAHMFAIGMIRCETDITDESGETRKTRIWVERDKLEEARKSDKSLKVVQDTPTGRKPRKGTRPANRRNGDVTVRTVDPDELPKSGNSGQNAIDRAIAAKAAEQAESDKSDEQPKTPKTENKGKSGKPRNRNKSRK